MCYVKYVLLNILACPMCKYFPLKVFVFDEERNTIADEAVSKQCFCDLYCGYSGVFVDKRQEMRCEECLSRDIKHGILYCTRCHRWYPIISGIPLLYPDDIRKNTYVKHIEDTFIHKYYHLIPREIMLRDPLGPRKIPG